VNNPEMNNNQIEYEENIDFFVTDEVRHAEYVRSGADGEFHESRTNGFIG